MEYKHHNLRLRASAQIRRIAREMAERKAAVLTPKDLETLSMLADDPCQFCGMVHCMESEADAVRNMGGEVGECHGLPCIDPDWILEQVEDDPAEE